MTNWLRRFLKGTVSEQSTRAADVSTTVPPDALPNTPPASEAPFTAVAAHTAQQLFEQSVQADQHRAAARDALRSNDFAGAASQFQALVELQPDDIAGWTSLGYALRQADQLEPAQQALETAVALDPTCAEPHYMLSELLRQQGRADAALANLQLAIDLDHQFHFAYPDLIELMIELGQRDEAKRMVQHANGVLPPSERMLLLEATLAAFEHDDEATLQCYRRVLELSPANADARIGMGLALQRLGHDEDGLAAFERCWADVPEHAASRWAWVMGQLPPCVGPAAAAPLNQQPFLDALAWFDDWSAEQLFDESLIVGKYPPFLLAYRAENHRTMLAQYGTLCARLAARWRTRLARPAPADPPPPLPPPHARRLRVGLVSPFFSQHSVWQAILKGWIKSIDRDRFELIGFHLGTANDDQTEWARTHLQGFDDQPGDAASWVERIGQSGCDALIYGSIGMDELSSQLAHLRLAPVQALTWGHPETSGLPHLDYYLSGDLFEPLNAQEAYSEQLIRLPNLGVNYPLQTQAQEQLDVAAFGLDANRPILICPGTPFKYSPLHDQVFVDIARRLPGCQLVFFRSAFKSMAQAFQLRIAAVFQKAGLAPDSCFFLPWMSVATFHALMRQADVFVDSIGFSGFNTALQAIECGLPVATVEGQFLRGRLASGILHRMEVRELIATDQEALVDLVVRLVLDADFNRLMRTRIAARRGVLFDDEVPVRALEQFLENAVASRRASALSP